MSALTEWNSFPTKVTPSRKSTPPLVYFLAVVFVLFIAILVFCYAVTKRTHPVFLDSHGQPVTDSSHH